MTRKSFQAAKAAFSRLGITRREAAWLPFTGFLYAALEGVGVGLLFPVLQFVEKGPSVLAQVPPSGIWRLVLGVTDFLGLTPTLLVLLALAFVPILARQSVRYQHQIAVAAVRVRAVAALRRRGFEAFLHADLPFFVSEGQGRLLSALMAEAERGGTALTHMLNLWASGVLLTVYLVLLFALSPAVAPIALLAMGAVALLVRRLVDKSREFGSRVSSIHELLHGTVGERLAGIRLVKMMGQERTDARRINGIIDRLSEMFLGIARGREAIEVMVEPLLMLGAFVTLYFAVVSFGLTLASLGIFLLIFLRVLPLIKQVNVSRQQVGAHIGSLHHVQRMIERARTAASIVGGDRIFPGLQEAIEFDHVSFSYSDGGPGGWGLRDISFRVTKGSLTAIVGRSGAGKSTLLDLIPRLRETTAGTIRFDGTPIQAFELRSLRSKIGVVDQHGFLFNDTVRNNLTYGLEEVTPERVEEAARKAYAHGFIQALPQGHDTVIGDRGIRLSGGQRQRLALARIFLQDPDILLLDEPTGALDAESEQYIRVVLDRLSEDKVVIVVAHRLSTIRRADQILVLDNGRIVEQGDHDTLLKEWGIYKQLFDLQIHA